MRYASALLLSLSGFLFWSVAPARGAPSEQRVKASDYAAGDQFGVSVSIAGRSWAVIGAPYADGTSTTESGKAYIFRWNWIGRTWEEEDVIEADSPQDYANFGHSVSISGNFILVGEPRWNDGGDEDVGQAHVFEYSGSSWSYYDNLLAEDRAGGDMLGHSVDVTVSGTKEWFAAGAPRDDHGNPSITDAGSVYVFYEGAVSPWVYHKLTANDAAASDLFGWSVSIDGDHLVTGARNVDGCPSGDNFGAAYYFKYDGWGGPPPQYYFQYLQTLLADDPAEYDHFGYSVAIAYPYIAVGAPYDDADSDTDCGSVHVFYDDGGGFSMPAQDYLLADDSDDDYWLGWSVDMTTTHIIAGAPGKDTGEGAAYVYDRSGTDWDQEWQILANDGGSNDVFGVSVSISGTYGLVGAPRWDFRAVTDCGAGYFYSGL